MRTSAVNEALVDEGFHATLLMTLEEQEACLRHQLGPRLEKIVALAKEA